MSVDEVEGLSEAVVASADTVCPGCYPGEVGVCVVAAEGLEVTLCLRRDELACEVGDGDVSEAWMW